MWNQIFMIIKNFKHKGQVAVRKPNSQAIGDLLVGGHMTWTSSSTGLTPRALAPDPWLPAVSHINFNKFSSLNVTPFSSQPSSTPFTTEDSVSSSTSILSLSTLQVRKGQRQTEVWVGAGPDGRRQLQASEVQPEPDEGEGTTTMEDLLFGTGTKDQTSRGRDGCRLVAMTSHLMETWRGRSSTWGIRCSSPSSLQVDGSVVFLLHRPLTCLETAEF